jgi:hypothetical protein
VSLRTIFETLYAEAEAAGEASRQLAQGARVTVRVRADRRQVILSRQGAPVGLVETDTFIAYGRIPAAAEGVCYLPRAGLYRVAYTWETPPPPLTLFDLPPADEAGTDVRRLLDEGERLPELL